MISYPCTSGPGASSAQQSIALSETGWEWAGMGVDLGVVGKQFQVDVAWVGPARGDPSHFLPQGGTGAIGSGEVQYPPAPREPDE